MGVLEQRPYGEPKARRERYGHAGSDEQLRLPDSVRAVRLGADGCVADTVEPSELKTRRSHLDVENRWKQGPPELACRVDAVCVGAGRVRGCREELCAGRQRVKSVARVHDSHTEEQSDVGRVAGPEQGNRLWPPDVRAALRRHVAPDEGHGHQQLYSPGQPSHEREHSASASREQGLAHSIQVMKKDLLPLVASVRLGDDLVPELHTY